MVMATQTSSSSSGATSAPRLLPMCGVVDRTQTTWTSKPTLPSTRWATAPMSLISSAAQRGVQPVIEILYLRGRLENSLVPVSLLPTASTYDVASMYSASSTPAVRHPTTLRVTSPQASTTHLPTSA